MPFGAGQLVLEEEVAVQERQLDGVGDRLDLVVEAADVVVGDVGHLLEDELLDLGARQVLEQQAGAGSMSTVSPARSFSPISWSASSTTRSSSARPTMRARVPSSSTSLRVTTSPEISVPRASTTLSDSLRTTSWPRARLFELELGVQGDPHLAAAGEHVDGAVVVGGEERAVRRRRLGELLDLLAQAEMCSRASRRV